MVLLVACSFEHGVSVPDALDPDVMPDTGTPVKWSVDSTSQKGVPQATFEWMELLQASNVGLQPPEHLWLMQDAAGSLSDSIGSITLDPLNLPTYQNAVSGWSRAAVGTNDVDPNQGFLTNAIGTLNGSSYLLLVYVAVSATPSREKSVFGIGGGGDHRYVAVTSAPVFKATGLGGVTPTTGMINPLTRVHPVVLHINVSQSTYVVYTDQERLPFNWNGTSGSSGLLIFGNATIGAAPAQYLYAAMWTGAKAEVSEAVVKKLLQGLGWSVTGY